jgi:N-acetylmuramoyl-L-alanine amidase
MRAHSIVTTALAICRRLRASGKAGSMTVVGIAAVAGAYVMLGGGGADDAPAAVAREAAAVGQAPAVVFIDPGHGGRDPGWGSSFLTAGIPAEKEITLDLAKRTAQYLEAEGLRVVLSRDIDTDVNEPEIDVNGDGVTDIIDELQARADKANASGAAVLLSIHFNGLPESQLSGSGTYYNTEREFSDENRRLAELLQEAQIEALVSFKHRPRDWGALADDTFETPRQAKLDTGYHHNTLIGPAGPFRTRPTMMPGVIVEPLFLTHSGEAQLAVNPNVKDALAKAYAEAIVEFLSSADDRASTAGHPASPHLASD